jgi:hypothetical protein
MTRYHKQYRRQSHDALLTLVDWAGSIGGLCKIAGVVPSTGTRWLSIGKLSKGAAETVAQFEGCPLTKEQIRPDIKIWDTTQNK